MAAVAQNVEQVIHKSMIQSPAPTVCMSVFLGKILNPTTACASGVGVCVNVH